MSHVPIDLDVRPFSRSNVTDLNRNGSLDRFSAADSTRSLAKAMLNSDRSIGTFVKTVLKDFRFFSISTPWNSFIMVLGLKPISRFKSGTGTNPAMPNQARSGQVGHWTKKARPRDP